jgi:hypothetical protein
MPHHTIIKNGPALLRETGGTVLVLLRISKENYQKLFSYTSQLIFSEKHRTFSRRLY